MTSAVRTCRRSTNADPGALLGVPWTKAELATLRIAYVSGGIFAARAALPNRTTQAIYRCAQRLKLSRRRRWSPADDRELRALWGDGTIRVDRIAKRIGRSPATTYWRAQKLHLALGAIQGREHISVAARRLGFGTSQIRMILRWAGVRIDRALSRPTRSKKFRTWTVDQHDATTAVERWMKSETVHAAAARLGVLDDTLKAWVCEAGHAPPRRYRAHWRLMPETFDAAVAAHHARIAATESLARAAMRVGVTRETLSVWLREAGLEKGVAKISRVEPAIVDRVAAERFARPTSRVKRRAA